MTETLRGFAFPFRIDPTSGGIARQEGVAKLKENLNHLLLTRLGERVMRRGYGGGVHDLLHEPNDEALRALAQRQIAKAIAQWEPRVLLQRLDIEQDKGQLVIRIDYVVRRTLQVESVALRLNAP